MPDQQHDGITEPKDESSLGIFVPGARGAIVMPPIRGILFGLLCAALAAGLVGEHLVRRAAQRQLESVSAQREVFQAQVQQYVASHQRLQAALEAERDRSAALSRVVEEKTAALEQALARLTEEGRTMQTLQTRLSAMNGQLERLQGELTLALEQREAAPASSVELERVVVSGGAAQGLLGRVVSIDQDWAFVVVDLGWDAVKLGDIVSIYRNDQLVAKARIDRMQEDVSAASLLTEWKAASVQVNDQVRTL